MRPNWLVAAICFFLGTFLTIALISYRVTQSSRYQTSPTPNHLTGSWGALFVWALYYMFGISVWLLPVFLYWTLYLALRNVRRLVATRVAAMVICVVSASGMAPILEKILGVDHDFFPQGLGGHLGNFILYNHLHGPLGDLGLCLLLGTTYMLGLLFIFTKDIGAEFEHALSGLAAWRENRAKRKTVVAALATDRGRRQDEPRSPARPLVLEPIGPANKNVLVPKGGEASSVAASKIAPRRTATQQKGDGAEGAPSLPDRAKTVSDAVSARKLELNIVKPEVLKKARATVASSADDNYKAFPLRLLGEQVRPSAASSEEEHHRNAGNLLRILGEFGVEVTLGEVHVGPVITRYEVVPAAGVRVEKISGLDKNIALGMRAQSVRILAPIPGKAAVGVEVPNQHPTQVGLREILESEDWESARAELPIALGKDVSGKPLISDLAKMPHLLIAGATGSGKSVCINAIVAAILYSKSPRDVRMLMIDPKVVELKIFNQLPHMLIPVVTESKKVPGALKWLLSEMEQRYQIFAKSNVRNIVSFNNRKKLSPGEEPPPPAQGSLAGVDPLATDDEIEIPDHMAYVVVIIDELADFMMTAPAEIETSIARLAQLARAAGIHLIIATQRPSVDVITGIIKANLPSRIAFQVASQVDSRTILDHKGAETLIGKGDMLFTPPGTSRIVRAQGAFVADNEIQEIVDFLKENNDPPSYAHEVQARIDRAASEDDDDEDSEGDDELGDDDELYQQALDVIRSTRRASTSMLQRRLRIGYNRAARIMELMEQRGIVGPENGSSPRDILDNLDNP
jgi:S-DNA-T family DNA segregation ATPase FtsK/SpoIIIE